MRPLFVNGVRPPSNTAYGDIDRNLLAAVANGSDLVPYKTLQDCYDSGAKSIILAPGAYGALLVAALDTVIISGNEIYSSIGKLTSSGGTALYAKDLTVGAAEFTDNDNGNFLVHINDIVEAASTIKLGAAGGHGVYEAINTQFGAAVVIQNPSNFIVDDFSERSFFSNGGVITSTVAGAINLQASGFAPNASIMQNADLTVTMTKRVVIPKTAISANRTLNVTPGAVGGSILIDSYNHSGHTIGVRITDAGVDLFTIPDSATASRYRITTTVLNTTWVQTSIEQLCAVT